MANIGPVGSVMLQRKHRSSAQCPRCLLEETNHHILLCKGTDTQELYASGLHSVTEHFLDGPFHVEQAIVELIQAYRDERQPDFEIIDDDDVRSAMQSQWDMGPSLLLWGVLHTEWEDIITEHLAGTRRSTPKWLAQMCNTIWEITDNLWKNRNKQEHKADDSPINIQRNLVADRLIDDIYGIIPPLRLLPRSDKNLFQATKAQRKAKYLKVKLKWIRRAQTVLLAYRSINARTPESQILLNFILRGRQQRQQRNEEQHQEHLPTEKQNGCGMKHVGFYGARPKVDGYEI